MRVAIIATNLETGEEKLYPTIVEASKGCFICKSSVSRVLKGELKSSLGYTFRRTTPPLTKLQAEIVIAMAESDLCVSRCARKLGKHGSAVDDLVERIIERTGKSPRKFYDLCELLPMAKAVLEEEHEH